MLLRTRRSRTLFKASMVSLLLSNALPLLVRPFHSVPVDIVDGVRGALLGATIALLFLFFRSRRLEQHRSGMANGE
jgi:hypothetical protein